MITPINHICTSSNNYTFSLRHFFSTNRQRKSILKVTECRNQSTALAYCSWSRSNGECNAMDSRRRSSVCSSVMSGSSEVSMYHNTNHQHINNNNNSSNEAVLKIERSVESPPIVDESGCKNFFLRWKGFEGNLIR